MKTKQILFSIFGDFHLGIKNNSEFWLDEASRWAKWFIQKNKELGIDTVVFPGDFFHNRDEISVKTIHRGSDINKLFKESHIKVIHSIAGNHDCYFKDHAAINSMSMLSEPFRIYHKTSTFEIGGRKICMVPWGDELPEERVDILIGHFDTVGFMMSAAICEDGMKPSVIMQKASLVLSGHFHKKQHKEYPEGNFYYVGNAFQQDFSDVNDQKGFYVVYDDLSLDFVPYDAETKFITQTISAKLKPAPLHGCYLKIFVDKKLSDVQQETAIQAIKDHYKPEQTVIEITYEEDLKSEMTDTGKDFSPNELFAEYVNNMQTIDDNKKKRVIALIESKIKAIKK